MKRLLLTVIMVLSFNIFIRTPTFVDAATEIHRFDAIHKISSKFDDFLKHRYGLAWRKMVPEKKFLGASIKYFYIDLSDKFGFITINTLPCCADAPWNVVISIGNLSDRVILYRYESELFDNPQKLSEAFNESIPKLSTFFDPLLPKK